jgi:hypothetical protein
VHPKWRSYAKFVPLKEVDVSTNHLGAHNTFGVSSSRVRVLMFRVFSSLSFRIHDKRPFSDLFVIIFL